MRCSVCGVPIKPWFEMCYQCYNPTLKNAGTIPEPIMVKEFIRKMEIHGWK